MKFDTVVVGAGLAGLTIAERLADELGQKVLIIEKRNHIGGNVFDYFNEDGILIHKYGPHIFHTNDDAVFEYLSRFTQWREFEHFVKASVDGKLVPLPITVDTVNALFGTSLTPEEMPEFLEKQTEKIDNVRTSEDVALSKAGRLIYEKIFKNYTTKQWGIEPSELDTTVISRIPVRFSHDNRYFADKYQGMPLHGYTRMCEKMIENPNIYVMLKTDYKDVLRDIQYKKLVFTGRTDDYYHNFYGRMAYRSLDFVFETIDEEQYQEAPVVNYPNEHEYTRITEFKWLTGQKCSKTTICKEIPKDEGEPYYPFPTREHQEKFESYKDLMKLEKDVYFVGRLAEYRYYNMDAVVKKSLELFEKIKHDLNNETVIQSRHHSYLVGDDF